MNPDTIHSQREFVSEDAWKHRKAFVDFSPTDEAILRELRPSALQYADKVMDELYARWLQFPELRRFFPDEAVLVRVKGMQRNYFISLTGGEYGAAYLASRLQVGAVHKRIGLTPEWFMGAFSIYLELILPRVLRAFEYDRVKQARAVTALTKLITLDQQLALVAYLGGTTADITLRKQSEDALLASQHELRELSARLQEAREEEKTRIPRELHDELGQLLTALKMDLAWLRERVPPGESADKLGDMGALLDQTVSSTRRISADLRPLMLDDLGLADAANWLVDDFARRSGVRCEMKLEGNGALAEAPKAVATAVYRALQESLTNIARHSGAKNAWIVLAAEDLAKVRSLGLKGMRERIAYLGGAFEVARAPRGGTRLRLKVPLISPS